MVSTRSSSSTPPPREPQLELELELELELDRLFQVPLGEFIAARNALAASIKKRGDDERSKQVKRTPKPSPSAWAVNQVYWSSRALYHALIEAGDGYRRAQKAVLSGASRTAEEEEERRRKAIDEAERRALALLREQGQDASPLLVRRIRTTLEALASYGSDNPSPAEGRLVTDLDAPGFAALASLGPIAPAAPAPPQDAARTASPLLVEERERRARRLEALEAAERELAGARATLEVAVERVESSSAELQTARQRLGLAESAAKRAAAELERARALVAELESTAARARLGWEETGS